MNEKGSNDALKGVVDYLFHCLELLKARETYFKVAHWWAGAQNTCPEDVQRSTNHLLYSLNQDQYLWQQLLYTVRNSLSYYHADQVILLIIEKIIQQKEASLKQGNHDVIAKLALVLTNLQEIWIDIVKVNFYPQEGPLTVGIDFLAKSDLKELSKTNLFLNYIVEIQREFCAKDVFRFIQEAQNEPQLKLADTDNLSLSLIKKEELVPELREFAGQYNTEMQTKFQLYASGSSKLLGVCDFLTLLKVTFQDRHNIALHLGTDISQTSIFKSVSATKIVFQSIYRFYFDVIKVDGSLPNNSKHKLRMNYETFLAIFNHLLKSKLIQWTESDQTTPEPRPHGTTIEGSGIQTILSMNLHSQIKKVMESESPLSYKLIETITELRAMDEREMKDSEKQVAKEVLKMLSHQLCRLKFYNKHFDSYDDHLIILEKERRKLEQIYFIHTSNSFYAHYNMKNPNIDLEKFLSLADTLGIPKLLQGFTKKNFVVLYMLEASRTGQVDFSGFLSILENLICKLLERFTEHSFASMLALLLKNKDKAAFPKNLSTEKRASLVLSKEKVVFHDKNAAFIKKSKNTQRQRRKDSEKEESIPILA